jgi:hypothetical protein
MQANRRVTDAVMPSGDNIDFEVLAAQRRKIYAKVTAPDHWWPGLHMRQWIPAAATVLLVAGGLLVYKENHRSRMDNRISDAQLAQEVSKMAQDSEPPPTAPLQELFEE